jgi:hypothetical protein
MDTWVLLTVAAVLLGMALLLVLRRRKQASASTPAARQKKPSLEALDTVAGWEPQVMRILSSHERDAYATLVKALPEYMVLGQVPLARFLRVPTRHSYAEWLSRVGSLSADLLVCDRSSQVLAVVEVHSPRDSLRSRQRHDRMIRVLKAAGIRVLVWREGELPSPASVRELLAPGDAAAQPNRAETSRPMPGPLSAIPVADVEDTLPGELAELREPPPSTWFDDFESQPTASSPPPPRVTGL